MAVAFLIVSRSNPGWYQTSYGEGWFLVEKMELGNLSFSTLTPLKNYDPHTQSGLFLTWFSNVVIRNLWKDLNWNHDSGLMQTLVLTK